MAWPTSCRSNALPSRLSLSRHSTMEWEAPLGDEEMWTTLPARASVRDHVGEDDAAEMGGASGDKWHTLAADPRRREGVHSRVCGPARRSDGSQPRNWVRRTCLSGESDDARKGKPAHTHPCVHISAR